MIMIKVSKIATGKQITLIPVNYIFSIGYRCNSVQFVRKYNMSKFSGPFDWMYIDLESSLVNIKDSFRDYLTGIDIEKGNPLKYMGQDYTNTVLPVNQKFTERNGNDLYDWVKICIFLHHDTGNPDEIEKIKLRVDRFNSLLTADPDKVMLVYISKILDSPGEEMTRISEMVKLYNIKANFVFILCSNGNPETSKKIENSLFIFKDVPDYQTQYDEGRAENEFEWLEWGMQGINFDKEYEIIKSHFDMNNLISKEEI
jgi:hypothetical protein